MKVKGTYVTPGPSKFISSRFLFTTPEEEADFFRKNPQYEGFLDLDDVGKAREPNIPYRMDKQLNQDIGEKVAGSPPKKPSFPKQKQGAIRPYGKSKRASVAK